jgi:hypothetical protein
MSEMTQHKGGGRPFQSLMQPHFDFIQQLRQRRKTWPEIAALLFTEKGIEVTSYAPYFFYRRKLKRMRKPHWESKAALEQPATVKPPAPAQEPAQATTTTTNPYQFNTNI